MVLGDDGGEPVPDEPLPQNERECQGDGLDSRGTLSAALTGTITRAL